jgi:uncharacterized protein
MQCPHDESDLQRRPYESDVVVDQCRVCDGVWLDKGELEKIQETVENDYQGELEKMPESTVQAYRSARSEHERGSLACPNCQADMTEREHGYCSQIFIDVCQSCSGVWLDKGELKALEVFFERSKADTRELRRGFWQSLRDLVFHGVIPD